MRWMDGYLPAITALAAVGGQLVWLAYARLLYVGFRHHERPLIIIHQAQGHGRGSSCLVINLSREPVHIVLVQLVVRIDHHTATLCMSDYRRISRSDEADWAAEDVMKEGPLRPGEFLSLGSVQGMLEASTAGTRSGSGEAGSRNRRSFLELAERMESLEIRVIAQYSAFTRPVAARRCYRIETSGNDLYLAAESPLTEQISSFRGRRIVYRCLREALK